MGTTMRKTTILLMDITLPLTNTYMVPMLTHNRHRDIIHPNRVSSARPTMRHHRYVAFFETDLGKRGIN
jgi:hypothetical protein